MESLEYQLNEPETGTKNIQKYSKNSKIIIAILITAVVLFLAGLIVILILYLKEKESKSENNPENSDNNPEKSDDIDDNEIFIIYNLFYATNNKIINSFKNGSKNFNETIGIVNNNTDYDATINNVYDLYIPSSVFQRKNKSNKIMLNIHGGMWMGGGKEIYDEECQERTKLGYICATMQYNFITTGPAPEYNIFRILDEITSVQEHIKQFLKDKGFLENKLEICLGGASAGAHLSLLYSYWLGNDSPIPIKFVYNQMGPVTLQFGYWYYYLPENGPLKSIEPKSIEEAKNENKIVNNKGRFFNDTVLTALMNGFRGRGFTNNMDYMVSDPVTLDINITNENFTDLLNTAKIAFPVNHINNYTLPTLSFYGGRDLDVGIAHYAYLRTKFHECNNDNNLTLIYSINSNHSGIETESPEGKEAKKYLDSNFTEFTNRYFSKD